MLVLCLAAGDGVLCAEVTNRFDMVAIARCGEGKSADGWILHGVTNYSDKYAFGFKLTKRESYAVSPEFPTPILSVSALVMSSSAQYRRLQVVPKLGEYDQPAWTRVFAYSGKSYVYESQTLSWSADGDEKFRQFTLCYDDGGHSTGWGLSSLTVVCAGGAASRRKSVHERGLALHVK